MMKIKEDGEWISFTKETPPNGVHRVKKGDREIRMNCCYGEYSNMFTGIPTEDVPLTIDDTCYWFKSNVPPPPPPTYYMSNMKPTATIAPAPPKEWQDAFEKSYALLKIDMDAFEANPTIEGMLEFAQKRPDNLSIIKNSGDIIVVRALLVEDIIREKMKDVIVVDYSEENGDYLIILEKK